MVAANASITHHDDAISYREDLSQSVGNEDCGDATRLEPAHAVEEPRRLLLSERGRRFVKNEQLEFFGERPRDDHELLGRKIQRAHFRIGIDVELKVTQRGASLRFPRGYINQAPSGRFRIQANVFRDAHLRNDVDLLRDKRHARALRLRGIDWAQTTFPPVEAARNSSLPGGFRRGSGSGLISRRRSARGLRSPRPTRIEIETSLRALTPEKDFVSAVATITARGATFSPDAIVAATGT